MVCSRSRETEYRFCRDPTSTQMAVHFLNTSAVAYELLNRELGERSAFEYYLANTLLFAVGTYYGLFFNSFPSWLVAVELFLVLIVTIHGLLKVYRANGAKEGDEFLLRVTCLSFPILFKITAFSIALGWILYFALPDLLAHMPEERYWAVEDMITLIWAPGFTAFYMWRLWYFVDTIREIESEKEGGPPAPQDL